LKAGGPLRDEHAYCRDVIRDHAHSFYFAARFLPADTRRDVFALYAFYRTVDDLVDLRPASRPRESVLAELDDWRAWLRCRRGAPGPDALRLALSPVLDRHRIPCRYFDDFLDGLAADLNPRQMCSFAEMEHYCYCVAGTVGIVLAHVLGAAEPSALESACLLGIAMQLTNILRDIGQDLNRGMIYLPAEELRAYNYSASRLQLRVVDADFVSLMHMQVQRARDYYRRGVSGIAHLSRECRLPILFAAQVYAGILTKMERRGYDVFQQRMATRLPEKLWIAGKSYVGHRAGHGWVG
jgi:phytoene synthase